MKLLKRLIPFKDRRSTTRVEEKQQVQRRLNDVERRLGSLRAERDSLHGRPSR